MISVAEARARMLALASPLGAETVALAEADGRTLAEAVIARRAQPPFDASAMDGYALRSADTPGVLRIVGEAGAGRALPHALKAGEAARIFTGAPMPEGADAVLIQEEAQISGDRLSAPVTPAHQHVRAFGMDFAAGAVLLEAGRKLDAPALVLAAAAGAAEIVAARRPRIAILCGGDEIVAPGAAPGPAQIFDSASAGVTSLATRWGAQAIAHAPLADDPRLIAEAADAALGASDLVVIIGGASVGDHDHARSALAAIGAELVFAGVAVRPGKPTWCARRGDGLVLGLPGNPASALVCARLFLRPLIERLVGGDPLAACATHAARLHGPLAANGPREHYLRATIEIDASGQIYVRAFGNQDSSLVTVFANSDALIVQAPREAAKAAGAIVPVLPF